MFWMDLNSVEFFSSVYSYKLISRMNRSIYATHTKLFSCAVCSDLVRFAFCSTSNWQEAQFQNGSYTVASQRSAYDTTPHRRFAGGAAQIAASSKERLGHGYGSQRARAMHMSTHTPSPQVKPSGYPTGYSKENAVHKRYAHKEPLTGA
jgi:hypothetical protein